MALTKAKGVTPDWWTPSSESEEEDPVRFLIQPLTPSQLNQVMVDVDMQRDWPCGPSAVKQCIRWGVKDWQGVYDGNGESLKYTAAEALETLPFHLQQEVSTRIVSQSMLTEADRKNS